MHSENLMNWSFSTGHAQCRSVVGKGRCFIRVSLCQKLITVPIEHLVKNERHTNYWYSAESIIGDQALRGIYTYSAYYANNLFSLSVHSVTDAVTLPSDWAELWPWPGSLELSRRELDYSYLQEDTTTSTEAAGPQSLVRYTSLSPLSL